MGGCCSSKNTHTPTNIKPTAEIERETNQEKESKNSMNKMAKDEEDKFLLTLKEIPLLSSLSTSLRRKLCNKFIPKEFKSGQDLMKQGDEFGKEFFIITSGKCKVIISNDDGNEIEIAQLCDGDYCGEQALLKDANRGATVRAIMDTKCLVLDQKSFKDMLAESGNIRFANRDAKRNAISAEMMEQFNQKKDENKDNDDDENDINKEKDDKTIEWLLKSVNDNILFSHLDHAQRLIVVKEMYKKEILNNEYLIKQGDEGNTFYVIESGLFIITVSDIGEVDRLSAGRCVGELALLYNAPRAASVQCTVAPENANGVVWCVDRYAFRKALMEVHTKSSQENISFLKKCELLKPLLSSELQLIDQALEKKNYNMNDVIFNKGDDGDRFYIIKSGKVEGIIDDDNKFELESGSFFGERALLTSEPRAASIRVISSDGLECLTLSRDDFNLLLGPLDDIMTRNLKEYEKGIDGKPMGQTSSKDSLISDSSSKNICSLSEFKTIGILGRGAFGTVSLVKDEATGDSYALKAIRKNQVVELGQQSHILNEKRVMKMMSNIFLVNLLKTYKDEYRVYFLLEVCLGGELFTILRKMRSFDESTSKFYSGCVVEAFDYMHSYNIIYRDLKPENLVLTASGYLKVTDFGFAKIVNNKTFTLCGTPDYLAPEIVTGQGHGKGVDWWTLGILIYEMLSSFPPFFDDEPMMTYRKIIQGKYKFPRYLSASSKDLISKLLKAKSTKRLGIIKGGTNLIRSHPWYKNFDWEALKQQKLKPPIKNKVKSHDDLSNFDHFTEKNEDLTYKGDPCLGWDKDF